MDDRFESSDIDISRIENGHILVARMLNRWQPAKPMNYRGMVAFFDSADCGTTWTEVSQIDPPSVGLADFDMGRLFADPWSSRIFYVVQDASGVSAAFISTNGGRTWTPPHALTWGYVAYRVTTLRSGRAYFFGTNANSALLYQFDPVQGWSSAMTVAGNVWDVGVRDDDRGLTRVGQFPDGDYVRALYPVQHQTSTGVLKPYQDVMVAVVKVSGNPPVATTVNTSRFAATASTGSIIGATFVETDRNELPPDATENTAMLYWQETNGGPSSTTTVTMKAALVRDKKSWTARTVIDPNRLPAFSSPFGWANYNRQGDYSRGAFFYERSTQSMNFLAQWVDGGVASNIMRFPQGGIPEEQFAPYESLGTAPSGGAFISTPAISSWASGHLDVFGVAADHSLKHRAFDAGAWAPAWDSVIPASVTYSPAAVSSQSGQIDLVVIGDDSNMYYARFLNGGWYGWVSVGSPPGGFNSAPSITTWTGGRLDVFGSSGSGGANDIWHAACVSECTSGGNWSGWENLGGAPLVSGPATVAWSSGRIDIFAVSADNTLAHKAYQGGWTGWESLDGAFGSAGPPAVSSWAPGRLDLFAIGTDGLSYHKSFDNSYGWSTWLSTNTATFPTGVGAVSWSNPRIDQVVLAPDGSGAIWHTINVR